MANAIFDGIQLHIIIPSTGSFDVQSDVYGAWKQWFTESDNAKYPPAFDTIGGDPTGGDQVVAPYFFCRNDLGWRIKMPSENGQVVLTGNLFPRKDNIDLFETTDGYTAFLRQEVSSKAVVATVDGAGPTGLTGSTSLTPEENERLYNTVTKADLLALL